ncbi:MAG: c-type cytochrome [Bacteroidota bacterium]
MWRNFLILGTILIAFSCQPKSETQTTEYHLPERPNLYDEVDLEEWLLYKDFTTHTINDPVRKQKATYAGTSFNEILLEVYGQKVLDSLKNDCVLEIICADGYAPQADIQALLDNEGYITTHELDDEENEVAFPKNYRPYYLIWTNTVSTSDVPWPYGVVSMRLVNLSVQKEYLLPVENAIAKAGLGKFKKHCIKCHAVNGIGGIMGPELNYPRNITQFFQRDSLYSFVTNPQAFRYNSPMPRVENLSKKDFAEILAYFDYIKEYPKLHTE